MSGHLGAHLLPSGTLVFDFDSDSKNDVAKTGGKLRRELEKRIYDISVKSDNIPETLFHLGASNEDIGLSPSVNFWRRFAREFVERVRLHVDLNSLRHKLTIPLDQDLVKKTLDELPFIQGAEYLDENILREYWEALNQFFQREMKLFKGEIEEFFHRYSPNIHPIGKIYFHLVENRQDPEFPFAFMATYASNVHNNKSKHRPLKFALTEYEDDRGKMLELLSTVNRAASKGPFLAKLLKDGDLFHPLSWSPKEALKFLKEVEIFNEAGILCRIPDWWKKGNRRPRLNITVGNNTPSALGMKSLVDFKANLTVDGEELSPEEIRTLLEESEGLAFLKGKWISVDQEDLNNTLKSWKKAQKLVEKHGIPLSEALKLLMSPQKIGQLFGAEGMPGTIEDDDIEIGRGEWLDSVLQKMRNPGLVKSVRPASEFKGTLRKYQQKGLDWLFLLHSLNFGACLADDMGLGKTVQILAFLQTLIKREKRKKNAPASTSNLLVLPTSLLANWAAEIKKFTPNLKFFVAHSGASTAIAANGKVGDPSKKKNLKNISPQEINKYDLVITTYGLVKRLEWIQSYPWNYVILDEAQAIKNPGTAQTKAIKKIQSNNRIVLTGTPVENRLFDLWSLFDFLNPGILGNKREFADFNKKINQKADNHEEYGRIRSIIGPYILRRLKTDRSIISDLPDKVEFNTFSSLSKKQTVLYHDLVEKLKQTLALSSGIQRKGIVLSSLLKFKQICNHPDHFLGQNSYIEHESGKFARLKELCETIYEKREKVLVFTQFREITAPLSRFLSTIFKREGLILHGGTSVKKRKEMVESFQSDQYIPYFVLSVKAGGTGLNLTAANHVIHFDRWWNPAVENQATDRSFRIGQKKNVIVHKFITTGTVEEKISAMIEEKRELANGVIGGPGENWITEMSDKDLISLFKIEKNMI